MKTERSQLRRIPSRGYYDAETVHEILDSNFLCHVAYCTDSGPVCIPTAYGRDGNFIFLHGSVRSQMLGALSAGAATCITVMQLDGIVLARSLFHSSMNYHSAVLFGTAERITERNEKLHALEVISESIWRGRWDEARRPTPDELDATGVVRFPLTEGSAKIRKGPAIDNRDDRDLDIWAGEIPVRTVYGDPVPNPDLDRSVKLPSSIVNRLRS